MDEQIITGIFTLLGVSVGLFGERLVRRLGGVRCSIDSWFIQRGGARPDGGTTAEERRLQVTFLNRKELPVTVLDMRVVFYEGDNPLEDWTRPHMEFVDDRDQKSPLGLVNLPPFLAVTRTISVTPGRDDKLRALEEADKAEFVASIVGARDKWLELPEPW
jgi:hypothetical protein